MEQNKCPLCESEKVRVIHKGVRDNPETIVYRCEECGMVFLGNIDDNSESNYENSDMHKAQYDISTDKIEDTTWDKWLEETQIDDDRREQDLKEICYQKKVLDFGCGNGGFLRRIRNCADKVAGIELETNAREKIIAEGISTYKRMEDLENKSWDIITMFHVIEHLNEPEHYLNKIYDSLEDDGMLIIETPNADDALISIYHCKEFEDFTYWSKHVRLYNNFTLKKLLYNNGFKLISDESLQRYSLNNHLYWLSQGKPGGHVKWENILNEALRKEYDNRLREMNVSDTLFMIFRKQ